MSFHFKLVTPEKVVEELELVSLSVPTPLGQITILTNHANLITQISAGELTVKTVGGEKKELAVFGGVLQVMHKGEVRILADTIDRLEELSESVTQEAVQRAKAQLANTKLSDEEYTTTFASLERALVSLRLARKHAHRRKSPVTGEGVLEE